MAEKFFLWNIVIKFAIQISACILMAMRLNLSKCGPLTKYSLIFCYILADLKMSLCTIYEAPGKLCFLYLTPFSSIFFLPDFLFDTSRILPLLHNLYHFIVRFSTSGKRKRIFWVKTWSRKINKPLWLLRQVSQNCTKNI